MIAVNPCLCGFITCFLTIEPHLRIYKTNRQVLLGTYGRLFDQSVLFRLEVGAFVDRV